MCPQHEFTEKMLLYRSFDSMSNNSYYRVSRAALEAIETLLMKSIRLNSELIFSVPEFV
jgi:hypothetical protein